MPKNKKDNLKNRGNFLDTEPGHHNRICVQCGKVYSPMKSLMGGVPVANILANNWCSRKCYEKDAEKALTPNPIIRLFKKYVRK